MLYEVITSNPDSVATAIIAEKNTSIIQIKNIVFAAEFIESINMFAFNFNCLFSFVLIGISFFIPNIIPIKKFDNTTDMYNIIPVIILLKTVAPTAPTKKAGLLQ